MNETQSAVKYSKDFEVPADFPEILRNLTREILRENPQNIEKFGKYYCHDKCSISNAIEKVTKTICIQIFS